MPAPSIGRHLDKHSTAGSLRKLFAGNNLVRFTCCVSGWVFIGASVGTALGGSYLVLIAAVIGGLIGGMATISDVFKSRG